MKRLILASLLFAAPAMAQQAHLTPSQQMVGQLASALAASQDREQALRDEVAALKAPAPERADPAKKHAP